MMESQMTKNANVGDAVCEPLPDGVGPHEIIEYELMVATRKNLALFSDWIPSKFVHNPHELDLEMIASADGSNTVYFMRGHRDDAMRLLDLVLDSRGKGFEPQVEREIGRLLGYEEWQIDAFLKHVNRFSLKEKP